MSEEHDKMPEMGDVTDDDKLWALLSLIFWPIALIALLLEEKRARTFVKHAAVQSLIVGVVASVLAIIPVVGCFTAILSLALWVYMIYQGIQAYGGTWVNIPMVTDFAKGQGWI